MRKFTRQKWLWGVLVLVVVLSMLAGSALNVSIDVKNGLPSIGIGHTTLTIGTEAYAAGTADYVCDGVADNAEFLTAINALPPNGGELVVLAGQYNFVLGVTSAKPNITISGTGRGTYFTRAPAGPIFTAGNNNWVFKDLRTDAGGLTMGATTGWQWVNVTIDATYYVLRSSDGSTIVNSITVSGLTSGRIPIVGASGLLGDDVDLTFSGGNTLNATNLDITTAQTYTGRVAGATAANGATWVDLLDMSVLTRPETIFGFTLTVAGGWGGLCQFRIVNAAGAKIYPFDVAQWVQNVNFVSGAYLPLVPFTIAMAQGYKIQFSSSAGGDVGGGRTCALTLLDTFQR